MPAAIDDGASEATPAPVNVAQVDPYPDFEARPDVPKHLRFDLRKPGRAQVLIEGGTRTTWETAPTSDNADLIIVEGCWPLAPRGQ
jgi:hypothetical protein